MDTSEQREGLGMAMAYLIQVLDVLDLSLPERVQHLLGFAGVGGVGLVRVRVELFGHHFNRLFVYSNDLLF